MLARVRLVVPFLSSLVYVSLSAQSAPQITASDRNPVPVGYSNCFYGSGFGPQSSGSIAIGNSTIAPDSWVDTAVCLTVPSSTPPGDTTVQVSTANGVSNPFSLTITGQPAISGISPTRGQSGAQVTITGTNFGGVRYANSSINWNSNPMTVVAWSDTQIIANMASGLPLGSFPITVYNNGLVAQSANFTITAPLHITQVTDNTGSTSILAVGNAAIIAGNGFGTSQGASTVALNGETVNPYSWSDTAVGVLIPSGTTPGLVGVQITTPDAGPSNTVNITVTGQPAITGFTPTSGPAGTQVTITGTNFGPTFTPNLTSIFLGGVGSFSQASWSDSQIVIAIPAGALPMLGQFFVNNNGLGASSANYFMIVPSPQVTAVAPAVGAIGDQVTISGSGFARLQQLSLIYIGGVAATVVSWSDTQIVAKVPTGAQTGTAYVAVADAHLNYVNSNAAPFTVLSPVLSGSVGQTVTAVTLTSPSSLDWIHWGTSSDIPFVRMAGATPLISDVTAIGPNAPSIFGDGEIEYTWTDGAQILDGERTTTGYSVSGAGNGFHLSIPADTTVKTLMLYVGAASAKAQLTASLSDNSIAPFVDSSLDSGQGNWLSSTYSIDFRATQPGQTLNIDYTVLTDEGNGVDLVAEVLLSSAVLSPHLPEVSLTSPNDGQVFSYPSDVTVNAAASQIDTALSKADFLADGQNVFELTSTPFTFTSSGLSPGDHVIAASVTDANGLAATSVPALIAEVQSGGALTASIATPTDIDISQGTSDWVHWGNANSANNLDRKAGITPQISDFTNLNNGDFQIFDATGQGSVNYSWSGGTPTDAQPGIGTQLVVQGFKNGFSLSIPAGTAPRTANLYLGYGYGNTTLRASLSDGSAAPFVTVLSAGAFDAYEERVVTLQFQAASANQQLIIRGQVTNDLGFAYADIESATVTDLNQPHIVSVSPTTGNPGTSVTISGTNFGDGSQGSVTLSGSPLTVNSWTDGSISATLTGGYISGPIVVSNGLANSNEVPFTYSGPLITSLAPNAGGPGTLVTIAGQNLPSGPVTVTFNGVQTGGTLQGNWVTTAVPSGMAFGPAQVAVQIGTQLTNSLQFDVAAPPVITSLTPTFGITGQPVKIQGANFGLSQANSLVYFGDIQASPSSWSESLIQLPVPAGFYGGIVTVVVAGQRSNGLPFVVPFRCMTNCNATSSSLSISPQKLSILVGDQADLSVVDDLGESIPNASFSLSDPTLGTIQTDNGVTTFSALAPGTVTLTATQGSLKATATITVFAGTSLPGGTIKWQTFGSGFSPAFIPAQPAPNSQTATFVVDNQSIDNVVIRALNQNGRQLWTWPTSTNSDRFLTNGAVRPTPPLPTPNGGVAYSTNQSIISLNANGQPVWSYSGPSENAPMAAGYGGTVYAYIDSNPADMSDFIDQNQAQTHPAQYPAYLVALDGQSGKEKFKIPMPINRHTVDSLDQYGHTSFVDTDSGAMGTGPLVMADGSVNAAVLVTRVTDTTRPNLIAGIPDGIQVANGYCGSSFAGDCFWRCPAGGFECWAAYPAQTRTDYVKEIDLVNVQPDGTYTVAPIPQDQNTITLAGIHYRYVDAGPLSSAPNGAFCIMGGPDPNECYGEEHDPWYVPGLRSQVGANGKDFLLVPNGAGGVLLASDTTNADYTAGHVWVKNINQPVASAQGPEYSLPIDTIHDLVIGENGTAFAAGESQRGMHALLVSFDLNAGGPSWTYESTYGGQGYANVFAVAAGPNNSLYASEGLWYEPRIPFTLDASGGRTDNPSPGQPVTYVASAGIGSDTWMGANLTQTASLGSIDFGFGMPMLLQSGGQLPLPGVTAYASTTISGIHSTYPKRSPAGREIIAIPVHVQEILGANIDPNLIKQQVSSALDYWESSAGLLFSWEDNQIQAEPNCLGIDSVLCTVASPNWLLDIVSSNPFDQTINATEKGKKLQVAYSRFHPTPGLNIVYVRQIDGAYALDIAITTPVHKFTNVLLSQTDRPISLSLSSIDLVLSHEIGHAFGLSHNRRPTNLMCANDPAPTGNQWVDFFVGLADSLAEGIVCGPAIEHRTLTEQQLREVDKNAVPYFNFVP